MSSPRLRIEPLPGFSPMIERLVGMLTYVRDKTVAAVSGLNFADAFAWFHVAEDEIGHRGQIRL